MEMRPMNLPSMKQIAVIVDNGGQYCKIGNKIFYKFNRKLVCREILIETSDAYTLTDGWLVSKNLTTELITPKKTEDILQSWI